MAIENYLSRKIGRQRDSLEASLASALAARHRVRRVFKQVPVTSGAGFDPRGATAPPGEFAIQPRTQSMTSVVSRRSPASFPAAELQPAGGSFVEDTMQAEDAALVRALFVGRARPSAGVRGARSWSSVLRAHLRGADQFPTPRSLVVFGRDDEPWAAETDDLKELNVTVVASKLDRPLVTGLLVPTASAGVVLRVEEDWQLSWDRDATTEGAVHLVMEARWHASVAPGRVEWFR